MLEQFEYCWSFLKELFELNSHLTDETLKRMRDRKYEIKDTYQSYRTINYWDSMGLLDGGREVPSKGWRKFSVFDLAFIAIITYLRNVGLSIEKIKVVKHCLYSKLKVTNIKNFENKVTLVEFLYYRAIALSGAGNTYLIVAPDGAIRFSTSRELHNNLVNGNLPTLYIVMNLNKVFKEFFKKHFEEQKERRLIDVSDEEVDVLWNLRTSEADKVIVTKHGNKITNIDKIYTGKKEEFLALHQLVENVEYGNVTLKVVDGKISNLEIIKKEKV